MTSCDARTRATYAGYKSHGSGAVMIGGRDCTRKAVYTVRRFDSMYHYCRQHAVKCGAVKWMGYTDEGVSHYELMEGTTEEAA